MRTKRVLVLSYYWPPSGGSGVQRWVKFAKYLPAEGWETVVYTPSNPEMPSRDESLQKDVEGVTVIRRKIFEPYGLYAKLFGRGKKGGGKVNIADAGHKSLGTRIALWLRGNLFIPDPKCLWIRPSIRFLKAYLREHPVDAIVSTGPPHSMHLIARGVAKATGLPWVADFRDPWTRVFYFKHLLLTPCSQRRHERLEKKVLDDASAVVAVSPMVQEEFQSMTSTPVELITNGFDEDDFKTVKSAAKAEDSLEAPTFTLTHTGLFAREGNPTMLWEVLKEKCAADAEFAAALRLRLLGKTDSEVLESIAAAGLSDKLTDLGYQAHDVAVREQMTADILLLPLRKEPESKAILAGKMFEYLGARRPILGFEDPDGAMARILGDPALTGCPESMNAGVVCDWDDKEGIAAFIDKVFSLWKNALGAGANAAQDAPRSFSWPFGDISRYSRRSTAAAMARLLDEVAES
ncbi:MAG: glycosyltransferase family 4 protein [Bacteroidales bacterium]|nr:glycosyltransferase family 4 protein [Bacteroidales bacterium]